MSRLDSRLGMVLVGLLIAPLAGAAQIQLVLTDPSGSGFRDTSPANLAAGANGATTLGDQRVRVLQRAAEIWGAQLTSTVPIRVAIRMVDNQNCGPDGTTLATAGPTELASNFPNAPQSNTSYHIALANALAGQSLGSAQNHINTNFNILIDTGCSPNLVGWWYGLDPDVPVPSDRMAMLPVALHELAHGLGFSAQINLETGGFFGGGAPTVWTNYLYDLEAGRHWRSMSNQERLASSRNDPNLVWTGARTNRNLELFLLGTPVLRTFDARARDEEVTELGMPVFGPGWPTQSVRGDAILVNDGVAGSGTVTDGCELPFVNGHRLAGRIALIDRGSCNFTLKVSNAQSYGAIGVVIVNNQEGAPPGMSGVDPQITIPSIGVSHQVGERWKRRLLRPRLTIEFGSGEGLAGVAQGCIRMYAPAETASGSSVSHFHREAFPHLLMEPGIMRSLFDQVDLTLDLFRDLGWRSPIAEQTPPLPNRCVAQALP